MLSSTMATTLASTVSLPQTAPLAAISGTSRLISLDIFRGLTIAGMILVNNPGDWNSVYPPLLHAEWNGWTPTDLIFPFFLFIVGVSMVFSFSVRRQRGASCGRLMLHAVRRSAIIFAIGFFLAAFPSFDLHTVRIPGVLQRIAVVYLAASLLVLYTNRRALIATTIALLVAYWLVMTRVHGFDLSPDGSLASWLDRKLMYEHLWVKHRWDPEGLLSTVPAIASALLGVFTGDWLRSERTARVKMLWMLAVGTIGLAVGESWGLWFPINKNLWTSSYVVLTAGFALVLLSLVYWMAEIRGWRRWGAPFLWYGSNAIVVYAASSFVGKCSIVFHTTHNGRDVIWKTRLYESLFAPLAKPVHASLLWALAYVLTFLMLAWAMYRKKIFIKV